MNEIKELNEKSEKISKYLGKEKKEELLNLLSFGDKYKKEGERLRDTFIENHLLSGTRTKYDRRLGDFEVPILLKGYMRFDDSLKKFEASLPQDEYEIYETLQGVLKTKFITEYLENYILFSAMEEVATEMEPDEGDIAKERERRNEIELLTEKLKEEYGAEMPYGITLGEKDKEKFEVASLNDEQLSFILNELIPYIYPGARLNLSNNDIESSGIKYLIKARKEGWLPGMALDLGFNHLGNAGARMLAKEGKFMRIPGTKLSLVHNWITNRGARSFGRRWGKHLQPGMCLNLGDNDIGDWGAKSLAKNWGKHLQEGNALLLYRTKISDDGIAMFGEYWGKNLKSGVRLDLGNIDYLTGDGVSLLAHERGKNLKPGIHLSLRGLKLNEHVLQELEAWGENLQPGIFLDLGGIDFEEGSLVGLIREWGKNLRPGIGLSLSDIKSISQDEILAFAKYRGENLRPGVNLDLHWNNIGGKGDAELVKQWGLNLKSAVSLKLSYNQLSPEAIDALAYYRGKNLQPMVSLDLFSCHLGDEEIEKIAEGWGSNLKEGIFLDLSCNNISDEGADAIMKNIQLMNKVKIDLSGNKISPEKIEELKNREQSYKDQGIECEIQTKYTG